MAGVSFLYGTFNDEPVFYIGSPQPDGYIYFQDRFMFRGLPGKYIEGTDWVYVEKAVDYYHSQRWMPITGFKLAHIDFDPGKIVGGGGSTAPTDGVEGAVVWAIEIANDDSHGYDQITRDGGVDYDCSSLVSTAFRQAGFDIPLPSPSTWTMRDAFEAVGFVWHPGNPEASDLIRGDIVLDIDAHVELYIGQQQLVGAHINEFGGINYGQPGDQTGNEISVGGYYRSSGGIYWDGFLRYGG